MTIPKTKTYGTCVDDLDIVPPGCSRKVIILHHCLPATARCLLLPTLPSTPTPPPTQVPNRPLAARPGFFRAVQKLLKSHSRTHRNRAKLRNPSISSVDSVIPGTGLYHFPRLEHAILLCQRFAPLKRQSINNCNTFSHDTAERAALLYYKSPSRILSLSTLNSPPTTWLHTTYSPSKITSTKPRLPYLPPISARYKHRPRDNRCKSGLPYL